MHSNVTPVIYTDGQVSFVLIILHMCILKCYKIGIIANIHFLPCQFYWQEILQINITWTSVCNYSSTTQVATLYSIPGPESYEVTIVIDLINNEPKVQEFVAFWCTVWWSAFVVGDVNESNWYGMKQYWWAINQALLKGAVAVRTSSTYEV